MSVLRVRMQIASIRRDEFWNAEKFFWAEVLLMPPADSVAHVLGPDLIRLVAASGLEPLTYGLGEHKRILQRFESVLLYSLFSTVARRAVLPVVYLI